MKTRFAAIVLLLCCFSATQLLAQQGNGKPATSNTYPFSMVVPNYCNGEDVQISGSEHVVFRFEDDGNGCFHMVISIQWKQVRGVGLETGTEYNVKGLEMAHDRQMKICPEDPNDCYAYQHYIWRFRLISKGGASNRIVTVTERLTINYCADPIEFTFQFNHRRLDCTGNDK